MKKRLSILVSMVALVLGMMPVKVEAVSANNAVVPFENYGSFATGDIQYEYTSEADGIKTWSFYVTVGSKYDSIYFALVPNAIEIQSVKAGPGFTLDYQADGSNGVKNLLIYKSSNDITSGVRKLLITVTTKDIGEDKTKCTLSVSPLSLACAKIDGNYFDKSGKLVASEADYKASCDGVKPNDVPNANTGNVVPYVAVGGGLVAILGVYLYSKKSNKMYKI